jgi:hypothetical protein
MYITAQRVRDAEGNTAIHVFRYRHDPERYPFPENPLTVAHHAPGILELHETELPMGGNDVLSYLDLIAPEEVLINAARERLRELAPLLEKRTLPAALQLGDVTVVFGAMLPSASPVEEYEILLERALHMLPAV